MGKGYPGNLGATINPGLRAMESSSVKATCILNLEGIRKGFRDPSLHLPLVSSDSCCTPLCIHFVLQKPWTLF